MKCRKFHTSYHDGFICFVLNPPDTLRILIPVVYNDMYPLQEGAQC